MLDLAHLPRKEHGPIIGLALGGGAARGWAHLGVLRALRAEGVEPDVVCGCSIGALVGAAYASGKLDEMTAWTEALDWQGVVGMLDISLKGGLVRGDRVMQYCAKNFIAESFTDLRLPFACVATELSSGREIWLREGNVADAVRASIALPGLIAPALREGRVLVDGGLVNPVPVSLCRAMGAELVIAVDLGSDLVGRPLKRRPKSKQEPPADGWTQRLLAMAGLGNGNAQNVDEEANLPSLAAILTGSINIMQMRIARSRLAGEPADMMITPRVAQLGIMDFDHAAEAIAEGEAAVERARPMLHHLFGREHG
ncbi:patatin-like phospholipase RssA [Pseudothauera nasutitermitis]|uniref:Patatin-like phospholipase RssA n=1 Tax=Pseudothauera nasutitermitis TaxID=2565930 RepID=A0A4S4B3K7_9RHOO|nr:patatin-like phospholipase RssA [Pseudothauera nasutitermitis]THF66831.1 patatin-like phospholipase RssA [Pseudothauera nasutitermitis]